MKLIPFDPSWLTNLACLDSTFRYTPKEDVAALVALCGMVSGNIVEIGANRGVTTHLLAVNFPDRIIYGVDYVGPKPTMIPEQTVETPGMSFGLEAEHDNNAVFIHSKGSLLNYKALVNPAIVFIDGDHTYEQVKKDTFNALSCRSVRLLIWHDCHPDETWSGVYKWAMEFEKSYMNIRRIDGGSKSLAYAYKIMGEKLDDGPPVVTNFTPEELAALREKGLV